MAIFDNLTMALTSLNVQFMNLSQDASLQSYRERLYELLQRLNESSHSHSMSTMQNELVNSLINQSEQVRSALERNAIDPAILEQQLQQQPQQQQSVEQISVWIQIILYVIYAVICALGVIGNTIVCFAVLRNPALRTVTNVFIVNLALSDILLCIFAVPFTPLYLLAYKSWVFGTTLCQLVPFAQGVSIYISAFTLMSIAIDRYFVIMYPLKSRMEMKSCVLIIICIWLSTSILTWPYAHFMMLIEMESDDPNDADTEPVLYCDEQWPYDGTRKIFGTSTTILQFVIPFAIISYCYVHVCGKLWDRAKTIPGSVSARREELERERARRTNGMLISMVAIFVISWLPLNIYNLLMDFYEGESGLPYQRTVFLFVHAIAVSSAIYNPWIYAWHIDCQLWRPPRQQGSIVRGGGSGGAIPANLHRTRTFRERFCFAW